MTRDVLRAKAMTWQSAQEIFLQNISAFYGKFGKTSAVKESRERSAEQLFADPEPAASAVQGSDLGPTEDPFKPTASCMNNIRKRQLVTRSGLPRLRCCVMPCPPQGCSEFACCCSRILPNNASTGVSPQGRCHCGRCQGCS